MKRVSKRVRDEAALICALMASNPKLYAAAAIRHVLGELRDEESTTEFVAGSAWRRSFWNSTHTVTEDWAEAEALLRTGWSPS